MRHTLLAAGAALLPLTMSGAMAQDSTLRTQQPARQAESSTTGQAPALQDYVLMLQEEEEKLKAARDEAARGPAQSQAGAMSEQRMDLMHTLRGAWRTVQRAPADFAATSGYQEAERQLRRQFGEVGPNRRLEQEEGVTAADDALRTIAALRLQAARAAQATGESVPNLPGQGGARAR